MHQRKCCVCEKAISTNVNEPESKVQCKSICAECSKIALAVSIALFEINRRSHTRPSKIQVPDVVKIILEKNFMKGLRHIYPSAREVVKDLANPLLRMDYLDEEKINRCFDFFEEAEDMMIKRMGKSNYEKRQSQHYNFIKNCRNVKELIRGVVSRYAEQIQNSYGKGDN